ncbi:glutathione-disulfide reductase [Malassezia cuniculi]|uniref:Glutathione reductase n=1 Tax=Malassezia cuniculi TaxID=948313 RepID=A0AAF0EV82_9BASI|nr:glutathione-disulfide reductase [Malassezia cuniculi]
MPPVNKTSEHYDVIVVGGGSGGLGAGRRASALYGKKVAIIESDGRLGGTCVNVGCVPKKVMWYATEVQEYLRAAGEYGFEVDGKAPPIPKVNWGHLVEKRESYIRRLNGIYERNVAKDKVDYIAGYGRLLGNGKVHVTPIKTEGSEGLGEETVISADHIVIATGGRPSVPSDEDIPGASLGITSDGFFALTEQPKRVMIIGAGYIAVELASLLHHLGSTTYLVVRGEKALRNFDPLISDTLLDVQKKSGMNVITHSNVKRVDGEKGGPLSVTLISGEVVEVDQLIWAIGRKPNTEDIGLKEAGVGTDSRGYIVTDRYQNTNVSGIYSVGDVQGKVELTPVAIAAGRRLANRLFGGEAHKDDHLDYDNIATAVFTHPTIGTVGLTEPKARALHADKKITIYRTSFTPMFYSMLTEKSTTAYKIVCVGEEQKVVGVHMIGPASDETIQAVAIAVKMGATKKDFDDTVAVHPTSAEELVTTYVPVQD